MAPGVVWSFFDTTAMLTGVFLTAAFLATFLGVIFLALTGFGATATVEERVFIIFIIQT
jgi:hypothetical protein